MAAIAGQRTTGNIASEQRAIDLSKPILLLEPDAAPLTVILNSIEKSGRKEAAQDTTFFWDEDQLETRFDAVNHGGGYNNSATSIVVDTGDIFYTAAMVMVPRTGEIMYVSGVSTNTLTVTRGFAGTTAAAVNDDEPLFVMARAVEEGDTSFAARTYNPTKRTNYTEIFRTSVEASGSSMSSANQTSPHDWTHQHKKKAIEHLKEKEHAYLFGAASTAAGPSTGKPLRTTGGVLAWATQNRQDAGGTLTEAEFETFLRTIFRYGSKTKTVFCSPLAVSVLNNFSLGRLQTHVGDSTYGVQVMEWVSAHGTVKLVKHNLLEGAVWGGYAVAVDFGVGEVKDRYLNGNGSPGGSRDTKLLTNRQENDRDGQRDEWLTESGLQLALPGAHGVLYGITG